MYKSTDLMNWQKVGAVITVYTPDVNGNQLLTYCHFERPKLMKSKSTGKYVIWAVCGLPPSYASFKPAQYLL